MTDAAPSRRSLIVPVLLIGVGLGWLLTSLGVAPQVYWAWSLGLVAVGVITLANGIDKVSIVLGPLFLLGGALSVLRQSGTMALDVEVPILVLAAGVLMLFARSRAVRVPAWIVKDDAAGD